MSGVLVTGSAGLIGAETVRFFAVEGFDVVGIDNDMRRVLFGDDASTAWSRERLEAEVKKYRHIDGDVRDRELLESIFNREGARFRPLSTPPPSLRMTGPRATRRPISASTLTARSTCLRPPAGTVLTRPSYLPARTRFMATRPTCCRWSKRKRAGKCGPTSPSPLMASTSR